MIKPTLIGPKSKEKTPCVCSFCGNLFRAYKRWVSVGAAECPNCFIGGTSFIKELSVVDLIKLTGCSYGT